MADLIDRQALRSENGGAGMSDLIERQDAIKAIENLQDCYNGFSDTYDKACIIGVIEEIPTAQVNTPTDTPTDTISRQAAIDAFEEQLDYLQSLNKDENPTVDDIWYGVNWARNTIAELPSAQPNLQPTCNQLATDCISRQAAIDEIARWIGYIDEDMILRIQTGLKKLPSAQRTGRWEYVKKRLVRGGYVDASECSVCHKRIMPHLKPNFCPNCGAKMEEEQDEQS